MRRIEKAISYFSDQFKPQPWQTLADVEAYLEVFYHRFELKEYKAAFKVLRHCDEFLTLRGYSAVRVEYYGLLIVAWPEDSQQDWQYERFFD